LTSGFARSAERVLARPAAGSDALTPLLTGRKRDGIGPFESWAELDAVAAHLSPCHRPIVSCLPRSLLLQRREARAGDGAVAWAGRRARLYGEPRAEAKSHYVESPPFPSRR
jgi:hypothetical protein